MLRMRRLRETMNSTKKFRVRFCVTMDKVIIARGMPPIMGDFTEESETPSKIYSWESSKGNKIK